MAHAAAHPHRLHQPTESLKTARKALLRLAAVQRGLPERTLSPGAAQLVKVLVKESKVRTKQGRQRCAAAVALPTWLGAAAALPLSTPTLTRLPPAAAQRGGGPHQGPARLRWSTTPRS